MSLSWSSAGWRAGRARSGAGRSRPCRPDPPRWPRLHGSGCTNRGPARRRLAAAAPIPGWRSPTWNGSWPPCRGSSSTLRELAENPRTTEILLQVFSTSQYLTEVLIRDPELLDWLQGGPERRDRSALIDDLWATVAGLPDEDDQKLALRRFRRAGKPADRLQRHRPRISPGSDHPGPVGPGRCVRRGGRAAGPRRAEARFGAPMTARGSAARFVVLGLGKLGGAGAQLQLGHRSGVPLRRRRPDPAAQRSCRTPSSLPAMGSDIVRLLADHTALGIAYRVDMRLRPDGEQGVLARSLDATLGYYVTRGRTWERQALIKCRPVAGDLALGETFLEAIKPFVYRRYLGAAEISEIKALKRRIEQRTVSAGHRRGRGQDGQGRDSRRRVRRPVPPIAARRRVSRGSPRDHAPGALPGSSRSAA